MSNPHKQDDDSLDEFLGSLNPEDRRRLLWLANVVGMVEGWCRVNRAIGKFIIVTIIGLLIVLSNGLDAVKNLIGWKH